MTFLFISFIAGVLTILAPCILPMIPVVIGHSLSEPSVSRRRLFFVVSSLFFSVIIFTLLIKASTAFVQIPQVFWTYFSGGIITIFGILTVFPDVWARFSFVNFVNQKSNIALAEGYKKNNIWGDAIVGASLGPIFSACSPTYFIILATVLPASFLKGLLYLIVYAFGLTLSFLLIGLLGQKIINTVGVASDSKGVFKKVLGILFIIIGLLVLTGYDKKFQTYLLDKGYFDATRIEQKLLDDMKS